MTPMQLLLSRKDRIDEGVRSLDPQRAAKVARIRAQFVSFYGDDERTTQLANIAYDQEGAPRVTLRQVIQSAGLYPVMCVLEGATQAQFIVDCAASCGIMIDPATTGGMAMHDLLGRLHELCEEQFPLFDSTCAVEIIQFHSSNRGGRRPDVIMWKCRPADGVLQFSLPEEVANAG